MRHLVTDLSYPKKHQGFIILVIYVGSRVV